MVTEIPSVESIRGSLQALSHAQVTALAEASAVPFTTLWKVRQGDTANPGIETVRKFMPFLATAAT